MSAGKCCHPRREEEQSSHLASAFQEKILFYFFSLLSLCIFFDFSKVFLICTGMNPSFLGIFAKNLLLYGRRDNQQHLNCQVQIRESVGSEQKASCDAPVPCRLPRSSSAPAAATWPSWGTHWVLLEVAQGPRPWLGTSLGSWALRRGTAEPLAVGTSAPLLHLEQCSLLTPPCH